MFNNRIANISQHDISEDDFLSNNIIVITDNEEEYDYYDDVVRKYYYLFCAIFIVILIIIFGVYDYVKHSSLNNNEFFYNSTILNMTFFT